MRSKLSSKSKMTAINTFAAPVIRYPAAVVSWRQEDLKGIDVGTRKLMTMLWKVKIMVIPVVVSALGAITDRLPGWLAQIAGTISEVELRKSAFLGTVQDLRRVFRLPGDSGLW